MFSIRYAKEDDKVFWFSLETHFSVHEFELKVRDKRGYIISYGDKPVGVMCYNLIWDIIPFITMIYFDEPYRKKGLGRKAILFWENEMRSLGYKMVMTSTQVNEPAQHFYRKLGYTERGGIFLDATPYTQPQEMFMLKAL